MTSSGTEYRPRSPSRAFTLVELLLVVTIIGILASLVVPRFVGRSQEAKVNAARQEIAGTLGVALDLFEQDMGRYPTAEEGLQVLITLPSQGTQDEATSWKGPYLKSASVPIDPWGREYQYAFPSQIVGVQTMYDLVSAGSDGQFGSEDDITNHNLGGPSGQDAGRAPSRRGMR